MIKGLWQRLCDRVSDRAPEMALVFFIATFMVVLFKDNIFITIKQGHYGVMWHRFSGGTDLSRTHGEGVHIIFPWDKMMIFDGRLQMVEQQLDVLSSDGLAILIDVSYRFELIPSEIPSLARYVGPDYERILIGPSVATHARAVFSRNTPEEIFARRRDELNNMLTAEVQEELDRRFTPSWRTGDKVRFVEIEDVIIRGITLPQTVAAAIETKNIAKQENEAYDYRLLSESKEAERKQIEARGIKAFQDIVAPGLTDTYLRWQGIQATQALANSPNSKLVVIGSGGDGLPIILGGWESERRPDATAPATAAPETRSPPGVHADDGAKTRSAADEKLTRPARRDGDSETKEPSTAAQGDKAAPADANPTAGTAASPGPRSQ